jgi:hypothetical protein
MSEIKVNKISPRTNCGTTTLGDSGDSILVSGDLKSDSLKAADGGVIISQSGTTITLGASGDTVSLASGAAQSGFGRTGTVDWQTGDIKTGTFTAENGKGYFVNTSSGAVTGNLPSSPSAGDIVAFADYAGTSGSNNVTIGRNGSLIEGQASDAKLDEDRDTVTLVYVDGTQGWLPVNDNTATNVPPAYVTATGGTASTCGDFKFHKFTGPGTFCVSCAGNTGGSNTVQVLIVAGGGAGGGRYGGGGGAGGMVFTPSCGVPISASPFPIAVGGGGTGQTQPPGQGGQGTNSTGISLTGVGGGGGVHTGSSPTQAGGSGGGSGQGGGIGPGTQPSQSGNSGTFGFGNNSGCGSTGSPKYGHAGGGGAGAVGSNGTPSGGGTGGSGKSVTSLFPAPLGGTPGGTYAGGGGGGSYGGPSGGPGPGGGGNTGSPGGAGTTNTGGGGGGSTGNVCTAGGNGGSGIVIIRYKYQN